MTQRNPMNDRYQNDDKNTGHTRKSAASAKPKTKAASSVYVQSKKAPAPKGRLAKAQAQANKGKSSQKDADKRAQEQRYRNAVPNTPEYKMWRRIWWIVIALAVVCTAGSWLLMNNGQEGTVLVYVAMGLGYAFLIGALVLDLTKMRSMRKEYQMQLMNNKSKEAKAMAAAEKAEAKAAYEKAKAKEAEKAARKAEHKGGLFGKKNKEAAASKEDKDSADSTEETD